MLVGEPQVPSVAMLADRLLAVASTRAADTRLDAVRRTVGTRIMMSLAKAARDPATGTIAATQIDQALEDWARSRKTGRASGRDDRAWSLSTARLLLDRDALAAALKDNAGAPKIPPGMPIGGE